MTAEMSPVETLRAAAARLRELASGASKGPWVAHPDGLVWADRIGDPVSGSVEPEDAEWIALVHPGVAGPLADWLEHEGSAVRVDERALKFARVLLGVPDGR